MNHSIQQADLDYITDYFAKRHSRGHSPSTVWGAFDRSGPVATGSTGVLPDGTTPTEHTAYRIASCTKSFAAASVLALRDEGSLGLDDPITRYLPAFSDVTLPTTDSPTPTLRMLLTMSAGFPTDNPWGDRQEPITNDDLDDLLRGGLTFDSVPGTEFAYSNLGYALVGRAIEAVSGSSFIDFVTERFLRPLDLTGTGFDESVPAADGVAVGTRWLDDHWEPLPFSGPGAFSPIGGLFSTVADLGSWAGWLASAFDEASAFDQHGADASGSPLSRASRRELHQVQRFVAEPGHPGGYGLGLHTNHYPGGDVISCHSGGYPGFSAHMRWSQTSGVGLVAFENATGSRVPVAVTEVLDHLVSSRKPNRVDAVLSQTRAAQAAATELIRQSADGDWSDEAADALFAENVAMDDSYERRRKAIAAAVTRIGGLDASAAPRPQDETSQSPSHLAWFMPGKAGRLKVELQLTPQNPPLVQQLQVSVDKG